MKTIDKGLEIMHHFESCSLKPYLCPAKIPTIGWGNTFYEDGTKVTMKDNPISQERADELFKKIVSQFESKVDKVLKQPLAPHQYSAILCFTYNVGIVSLTKSTLLKKVNINPNDPTIPAEFLKWNKAGSTVLKGLTRRRQSEAHLYKHNEVNFYKV